MSRTTRRRRGNYALEFALCLPIWFTIISATMDYGWLIMNQTILDSAANRGCRAGSIIDPGNQDQYIRDVTNRAEAVMESFIEQTGIARCDDCEVLTATQGAPPSRRLVCNATWTTTSVTRLFWDEHTLRSRQIARLEWQREEVVE